MAAMTECLQLLAIISPRSLLQHTSLCSPLPTRCFEASCHKLFVELFGNCSSTSALQTTFALSSDLNLGDNQKLHFDYGECEEGEARRSRKIHLAQALQLTCLALSVYHFRLNALWSNRSPTRNHGTWA